MSNVETCVLYMCLRLPWCGYRPIWVQQLSDFIKKNNAFVFISTNDTKLVLIGRRWVGCLAQVYLYIAYNIVGGWCAHETI